MMFPKPENKKKSSKILNRKARLHDIPFPDEKHCRRCNRETGTERLAHYEGFRKHEFGKGIAQKVNDNLTAWLCQKCTNIMDKKTVNKIYKSPLFSDIEFRARETEHSEEWLYLIIKTWLL